MGEKGEVDGFSKPMNIKILSIYSSVVTGQITTCWILISLMSLQQVIYIMSCTCGVELVCFIFFWCSSECISTPDKPKSLPDHGGKADISAYPV